MDVFLLQLSAALLSFPAMWHAKSEIERALHHKSSSGSLVTALQAEECVPPM